MHVYGGGKGRKENEILFFRWRLMPETKTNLAGSSNYVQFW
jgi:hypothetical protein